MRAARVPLPSGHGALAAASCDEIRSRAEPTKHRKTL